MTATRILTAEHDEYAEHVTDVSHILARAVPTGGQSLLDRDDVDQIMRVKGWEDRARVHGPDCGWPSIPEDEPACCGLMCTSLLNAAYSALARERRRRRKVKVEQVDPAAFTGGASDWQPIHDEIASAAGTESDPWGTTVALLDVQRAMGELSPEHRDVVRYAAEEYTLEATGAALGIPLQTVAYRLNAARLRLKLLLAVLPD